MKMIHSAIVSFSRGRSNGYGVVVGSALIVGASRGIGLGLVDAHLEEGWTVHATTRDGTEPRESRRMVWHRLEVRDSQDLVRLAEEITVPVDRIVYNAGIMRAPRSELMEVNAEAPIRVTQELLDAGRLKLGGLVAIMTSQLGARRGRTGSLGDYGDSKAALNDEFRRRTPDWADAGAVAVVIHPGWVQTDMGGPGASLRVGESVSGLMEVLENLTADDHGKFLTWDGKVHPW